MRCSPLLYVLLVGIVGSALLAGCDEPNAPAQPAADTTAAIVAPPTRPVFDVRAVTLDARRRPDPEVLVRLRDLGATHLSLVSFGWQRAADDPRIRIDTTDGWYSESHRGIRTLARQADTLGMDIILKPHIWIGGYDEAQNRSDIGFETEAQWARWEEQYRRFLMIYARLAAEVDADVLVLGTELRSVATTRPDFWRGLARDVRSVYDGDLTYAANWHKEYQTIEFWDALDYVGVQAYFPLADAPNPSLDTLRARWRSHRKTLSQIHRHTGKPVLFTEIGYRSARGTARAPWRWPEEGEDVPPDSSLQAQCYRAFLSTMERVPWFAGGIIWKWHPEGHERPPTAFTPQNKPAERVLRRWFTGAAADTGRAASGSSGRRR